jgi:hypothetical protein
VLFSGKSNLAPHTPIVLSFITSIRLLK